MLFNSFEFVLFFLPATLLLYYSLTRMSYQVPARFLLLAASLFFYSWWNPAYLPLIVYSVLFNFFVGKKLNETEKKSRRKALLTFGVGTNLLVLGYFKYSNFFLENVSLLIG